MREDSSPPVGHLMAMGASLGLLYGLFEGAESFFLSLYPQGRSWQTGNSVEAVLFMPAFYVVAFSVITLGIVALSRVIKRAWWDFVLVALLGVLSGYFAFRNQGHLFSETSCILLGLGVGSVAYRAYRKHHAVWSKALLRGLPVIGGIAALIGGGAYFIPRLIEARQLSALPTPTGNPPNVLLLVIDTQRADPLSSYGYRRRTTPHIDSLAAQGTLFEEVFAPSSWTLPSHASMFTGRLVHEHGAGDLNKRRLGPEYQTLAEALGARGFATAGFVGNVFWTGRHTGLARGFQHFEDYYGTLGDAVARTTLGRRLAPVREALGWVDIPGRKRARDVNGEFLTWLDRTGHRPFFAFLNYMDVHAPYLPVSEYEGRFGVLRPEFRPTALDIGAERHTFPPPDKLAYLIDRYDECLLYLDDQIGRLLAELARRGMLERTLVILTSDHGEHLGEHNIINHAASLYTQEIQVPLILGTFCCPAGLAAGPSLWPTCPLRLPPRGFPARFPEDPCCCLQTLRGGLRCPSSRSWQSRGERTPPSGRRARGG